MGNGNFSSLEADEAEAHLEHMAKTSWNWDTSNPNDRSLGSTPTTTNHAPKGKVFSI